MQIYLKHLLLAMYNQATATPIQSLFTNKVIDISYGMWNKFGTLMLAVFSVM